MQRSKEELSQCKLDRYEDNIKDLPDRIQNQAQWLKEKFDGRTDKEVMSRHNNLIDLLMEYEVFRSVASDDVREMRVNEYNQLEVKKEDKWTVTALNGHLIVTPDGRVLPMRERLSFRGEVEMEDDRRGQQHRDSRAARRTGKHRRCDGFEPRNVRTFGGRGRPPSI